MAEQIGRYEIRRELRRGGMATVHLAFDPRFRRQVAVKVLPRQFTHDPKYLERFEQEAQMIATLEHPAIVPVHDFGEHEDAPYLVMRYMAGGSLRERLLGEPFSLEDIAAVLNRLAPALDYAHEVGVIHRDLKPSNILFDHQGNSYLADFGIARMAEASQTMTIIGTPAYMSPEQVESEVKLDGRSDIYALGVILYELLAGKQPYTAETPTGQMLMHITKPVPKVLEANPDLPQEAQQVIRKAMAKDREDRYQSAAELATAVNALIALQTSSGEGAMAVETAALAPEVVPDEPEVTVVSEPSEEIEPIGVATATGSEITAPAVDPDNQGSSLPGWAWWVGALALILIAVLGIRAIFNGRIDGEVAVGPTATTEEIENVASSDAASTNLAESEENSPINDDSVEPEAITEDSATETPLVPTVPTANLSPPVTALVGDTWMRPADDMTMVYVPAGSFFMGSEDGEANESPVHEVSLDAFWIDNTEVTNQQFAKFIADTGYKTTAEQLGNSNIYDVDNDGGFNFVAGANWQHPRGPASDLDGLEAYPVVHVSWEDADAYCKWAGAQLPSEAQWEYAARGPARLAFPWGDYLYKDTVNFCDVNCLSEWADENFDDGFMLASPVGNYPAGASWVGALDMVGNVSEWVNDWYDESYYANSPSHNPQGPDRGDDKVLRGGAWVSGLNKTRTAPRDNVGPLETYEDYGIRCIVAPSAPDGGTTEEDEVDVKPAGGETSADIDLPPLEGTLDTTWIRPTDSMTMVYVPESTFPMGSEDGEANEAPVHEVSLDAFWIDRTEVTNEQFAEFVAATDYETTAEKWGSSYAYVDGIWKDTAGADWHHPDGPASDLEGQEVHPVIHMSWEDANAYCAWAGGQLPTEAQWEFAARGPQGLRFPWGASFDGAKANYCDANCPLDYADEAFDDGYMLGAPVASFQTGASWAGALNMAGNVAEWVKDRYDEDYYGISSRHNPQGPLHGEFVVLRGGSWDDDRETLRSSSRINLHPDSGGVTFGIRCVVAPSATNEK